MLPISGKEELKISWFGCPAQGSGHCWSSHPLLRLSHQPCSQPVTKTRHETALITLANGSQEIINSFMGVTSLGTIKAGRKEPSGASDITAPAGAGMQPRPPGVTQG